MKPNSLATALISISLVASPVSPVLANDLGAGLVGAIIGGVIVSEAMKNKRKTTVSTAVYAERREVQTALNYFDFPTGTPDGVFGAKTRSAMSGFQYYLGFPVTGNLTGYETEFLLTSFRRAQLGGGATMQQVATNPDGRRGLLVIYREEMTGGSSPAQTTATLGTATGSQSSGTGLETAKSTSATTLLPTFGNTAQASLTSHCNKVSLLTNANGGFVNVANMSNPTLALSEQFCLARTYAIAESDDLVAAVQGYTPDQIQASCEGIADPMRDLISAVSLQSRPEVLASVAGFVVKTAMSPAQLSQTAKICLGVGYRTDNLDVAMASALLLVSLGRPVYGELLGHHLSQGIGATERTEFAAEWYVAAIDALDAGAEPAFAPLQPERVDLLRLATQQMDSAAATQPTTTGFAPIPVFKASE